MEIFGERSFWKENKMADKYKIRTNLNKLSKTELINLIMYINNLGNNNEYFINRYLINLQLEKDLKKIDREEKQYDKAYTEYHNFLKKMQEKYGNECKFTDFNSEELQTYVKLKNKFNKEVMRGVE